MKLSELLRGVTIEEVRGEIPGLPGGTLPAATLPGALDAIEIAEVRDDSRQVGSGDLFFALPGQHVDGHAFVTEVKQRGAAAVIVERLQPAASAPLQLRVKSAARALGIVAANRYGRPADALRLVAITGTNGKTTTTHLVEAMLEEAGQPTGLLGTITYRFRDKSWPAPFTTPTALIFHKTLAELRSLGAAAAALEASSHALALDRLHGVRFRVAAFTNLTQDHLDFHGDMEQYFQAKARLFLDGEHLLPAEQGGRAVVPLDDPYGRRLAELVPPAQRITVSVAGGQMADVSVVSEQLTMDGINAVLRTPSGEVAIQSRLTGRFNLSNLVLAAGIGVALGLPADVIGRGLSRLPGVPGRLERVPLPRSLSGPSVFVDYAHTPDALERALAALRAVLVASPRRGRLFVVFGCGGDRDTGKRAQMGQAAIRDADLVVITSDNPRTEDPGRIIDMIIEGVVAAKERGTPLRLERSALGSAAAGYLVEPDRRQAIAAAVGAARPEDVVLIAGKGHEDYQITGTARQPFDDREEAQKALAARPDAMPRSGPPGSISGGNSQPVNVVAATIELPVERVLAATAGKLVRGGAHRFSAVTIDSRAVVPGALFVAIRGQKHDGHQFCAQAVSAGATGLLVDRGRAPKLPDSAAVAVIEVGDTHVALGQLARAHREAPEIAGKLRVVAVTGSSGKTTTKDLIAAVLGAHVADPAEVLKTEGNLNNHFGVPLTLLRLRPGQRYAVVEMGMSGRGEIAYLTSLARPDVGVITNVGPAHLETLGTVDNIAAAKGELFTGLPDGAAAVYLAGDSTELGRVQRQAQLAGAAAKGGRLRAVTAAPAPAKDDEPAAGGASVAYRLRAMSDSGLELELRCQSPASGNLGAPVVARVPLLGAHHAENAALAAAAAHALEVPPTVIAQGLGRVVAGKHRGQLVAVAGRHVLDDCYNANPASTVAALRTLAALRTDDKRRTVAVLGDMLELGETEDALHREVGELAATTGLALLITVGARAAHLAAGAQSRGQAVLVAESAAAAATAAAKATAAGDWILIKGSRGMVLEHVLDQLRAQLEGASPSEAR